MTANPSDAKYEWFQAGDLNAFFALFLDNIVNLVFLATILVGFGFPTDVIYTYMIPGTALGVMFGDLVYTWLAFRLARQTGKKNITAMPLGLDTPSTIGIAFAVLVPAFFLFQGPRFGMNPNDAAMATWKVGMGVMLIMGLVKLIASFLGGTIQRWIPAAALLGSLAGIGIVWLAGNSLIEIYLMPYVGVLALGVIVFTLMARFKLPMNLPGAAAAVIGACLIYYGMGAMGMLGEHFHWPTFDHVGFKPPVPTTEAFAQLGVAVNFLPVAIPFGFLTIIGGINVTEGARLVGDDYKTRDILLTEAVATLLAGLFGGVAQSTPYIGHSAYKKMGARAAYTLATGIAVGLGAWFGLVQVIVDLIPKAAVAPILVFIGFEIVVLSFHQTPRRHALAVAFAIVPSVLNFGFIKLHALYSNVERVQAGMMQTVAELKNAGVQQAALMEQQLALLIPPFVSHEFPVFLALAQGYILTAMIWGAVLAFLIDRQIWRASIALVVGGLFTLCGLIHSVFADGSLYWPFSDLQQVAAGKQLVLPEAALSIPFDFALCYFLLAALIPLLYFMGPAKSDTEPLADE